MIVIFSVRTHLLCCLIIVLTVMSCLKLSTLLDEYDRFKKLILNLLDTKYQTFSYFVSEIWISHNCINYWGTNV